jgi:LPXTG-motif cell wall-anchored protein
MAITARLWSALLAAVLSVSALGVVAVGSAEAASKCNRDKYPTGNCKVYFGKGSYHRRDTVRFHTDKAFKRGETVDGVLRSGRRSYKEGPWTAGRKAGVRGSFTVPRLAHLGTATLTLVGEKSGANARGSFQVTRAKRHDVITSGSSTGAAGVQGATGEGAVTAKVAGKGTSRSARTDSVEGSRLPFTGAAYTVGLTILGVVLVGLGGLLVSVRRRRARNFA